MGPHWAAHARTWWVTWSLRLRHPIVPAPDRPSGGGPPRATSAYHPGGEFVAGDEPAMDALVAAAAEAAGDRRPARIAIVPTAAARQRPELAAAHGVRAF